MSKTTYENMDKDTIARWITLLSGIDTLDRFCSENGKDFESLEIKIPAIKHYMEETLDSIKMLQKEDDKHEAHKNISTIRAKLTRNFFDNVINIPVKKRVIHKCNLV